MGRTTKIQSKLDLTDLVKSAIFESSIQYRSDTDSDLPWTVRKYTPISKRKCKNVKYCTNGVVHATLLSAADIGCFRLSIKSRTPAASAIYWTPAITESANH